MSRPIRVLQLIPTLGVGGAEQLLLSFAQRLDRARFELYICSLGEVLGNPLQPEFERLGLPLRVIDAKHMYTPGMLAEVARYVRQNDIDIIHTHQSNADVVGLLVGRALRRPVVATMHSVPFNYRRERLYNRWLIRLTARCLATNFVAVSRAVREGFVREWGLPENSIEIIYNGVPMERYLPILEGTRRQAGAGPVITNIGRLGLSKGQHLLLDAARIVLERQPSARFMIVGQGQLEARLKAQAARLGIAERVTFAGMRRDIPAILAETDVFVLSSLWEGLPLTAVEAMAAARPVVLTDVGGNRELVEPGVQGLIVPPGDAPALAEALVGLLEDEPGRLKMGRAARVRVRHEFSMDVFVARHAALYEAMCSGEARGEETSRQGDRVAR